MPAVSYNDSLKKLVDENPEMGQQMLEGAVNALFQGEIDEGRILLRQYINATLGFAELGRRLDKDPKNIMRSLGPKGNPTLTNLMAMIQACASAQKMEIQAHVVPKKRSKNHPAPA